MTARVHHADLWGTRQAKYDWLNKHDAADTHWRTVHPKEPFYLFARQDTQRLAEYQGGWRISDAMPVNNVGIVTGQDRMTVAFDEQGARALATAVRLDPGCIKPVMYRPFDRRFLLYDPSVVTRARLDVMRHLMVGRNLALIATRQTRDKWDTFVTRDLTGHKSCAAFDINTVFPLYLYGNGSLPPSLFEREDGRRPNLAGVFVEAVANCLRLRFVPDGRGDARKTFGPEDVFHYAYAIFHSPTYRKRYAEFLKIDFPRLPLTGDKNLFARLVKLGQELVGLHLLENVPTPAARYPRQGDSVVHRVEYKPPTSESPGRVCINDQQYFDNVPPEVWAFHVGGYQVCEKWLKDRKGRCLSYDDIERYRGITEALRQTIRLMDEIDRAIPTWPLP